MAKTLRSRRKNGYRDTEVETRMLLIGPEMHCSVCCG